jgi:heparosan-N-sulfate-glucuronate 5-epimerase
LYLYLNKFLFVFLLVILIFLSYKATQGATENGAIKREADRFQGSLVFDKNDVPHYNYSYTGHISIGVQGSPHAVSQHALELYKQYYERSNETAKSYFINNVNWLVNTNMLKKNGSFSSYEFPFPWKNGNHTVEPPWRNGMANGEVLSPLIKAYKLTGNKTYLDTAKSLLNSFYIDVKDRGVTYKTPNSGWWFEQYASRNSTAEPRVLSGMIHAILDISEYYKDTNDTSAKFLIGQGILALKNELPKYDNNGTSFYDRLGWPANSFYKSLHVVQLKQLYELTHEPIFKTYYDKWNK